MEQTLAIIKPDAVRRQLIGPIISSIEKGGLKITAARLLRLTRKQAERFYAVHRQRPFFDDLTRFMSSGPIMALVLEGEQAIARWRELMGPTDPKVAPEESVRARFGTDVEKNAVHGSDGTETAAVEISFFFRSLDIVSSSS